MTEKQMINQIWLAQLGQNLIKIIYKKKSTKRLVKRLVEPYEMREEIRKSDGELVNYLYAWDVSPSLLKRRKHIKRWIIPNLKAVTVDERMFKPRFPIMIDGKSMGK